MRISPTGSSVAMCLRRLTLRIVADAYASLHCPALCTRLRRHVYIVARCRPSASASGAHLRSRMRARTWWDEELTCL